MSAAYEHRSEGCLAEAIGERGLSAEEFAAALAAAAKPLEELRAGRRAGGPAFLRLPESPAAWRPIEEGARALRGNFDRVLVLGTGGASLAGQVFAALAPTARIAFLDNLDPASFERRVGEGDEGTAILAISKSGETMETVALLIAALERLGRRAGPEQLRRRVFVLTQAADSALGRLARALGFGRIDHPPELGGRFSAFSAVGLVPALIAGLDARALVGGARGVLDSLDAAAAPRGFPPAEGAALQAGLMSAKRIAISVLMPYADGLEPFARWYCQLWAESLGKEGRGSTPVAARGAVDQHSQLQLYLAGPPDKLVTLVGVDSAGEGATLSASLAEAAGVGYLGGHRLGDVLAAELEATAEALRAARRPVRRIRLKRLGEESLGALMMHFMLETVLAARLLGVDPFNQPAVEEGKARARARLAKP